MHSIWFLDCLIRVLSGSDGPEGRYAVLEITAPAGSHPPPHVHHNEDEGFYVLEGELTLYTPGHEVTLPPGAFANGPQGVPHTFRVGPEGVRMLVISAPAGFVAFVQELGVPAERDEPPVLDGPADLVRLAEVAARHGIEFVGAPGTVPAPELASV